jgi:succinate dehydrogenase / fumarate reductase iron-sulfur subunit
MTQSDTLRESQQSSDPLGSKVTVHLRVKRFDPEVDLKPHFAEYTIEMRPSDTVLSALHAIKWQLDGTLSFRRSCAHGVCGSDAMMINGVNRLACVTLIQAVGNEIIIEPVRGLPVIKDLIVDMEPFFEQYRSVMPYLINDDDPGYTERKQSPEERARFDDTTKCILCGACSTSCPIYWGGNYVGPAALVNAHRFVFDSRDRATKERLELLATRTGVFGCRTSFNCTEACPRGIQVTEAIEELKRAVLYGKQ